MWTLGLRSLAVLILLPLGIFRVNSLTFVALSIRFTRKFTVFIIRFFYTIVVFFIIILLLISITVILTLFIVNSFFFKVIVDRISVNLLLVRSNDLVHSDYSLSLLRSVTISISHYF